MAEEFNERRRRARATLHWIVYMKRPSLETQVRAETLNLSSDGFYCLAPRPFLAGETLECTIVLPPSDHGEEERRLSGRATVLRVEPAGAPQFGIACRLEDYSLDARSSPPADWMRPHGR